MITHDVVLDISHVEATHAVGAWITLVIAHIRCSQVRVEASIFDGNFVSDVDSWDRNFHDGGGLSLFGEAMLTVKSSTFRANGAEGGGGLMVRGNCTVTLEDSTFEDNLASYQGGGMAISVSVT